MGNPSGKGAEGSAAISASEDSAGGRRRFGRRTGESQAREQQVAGHNKVVGEWVSPTDSIPHAGERQAASHSTVR
jgi:hypothetical protein